MTRRAPFGALASARIKESWRDLAGHSALSWTDFLRLTGPMPDRIAFHPPDFAKGDPAEAAKLREGIFDLPGGRVRMEGGAAPWDIEAPNQNWEEALNGFSWLTHFAADKQPRTAEHVRWLVDTWMAVNGKWDDVAWRPHVIARRLMSWFAHGRLVLEGSDIVWRSMWLRSISRQAKHLARTAGWAPDGAPRLTAALALAMTGLCLDVSRSRLERGIQMAVTEIEKQILPDGGHISRDPGTLVTAFRDFLALEAALIHAREVVPAQLRHAIDRMAPLIRFFRHGDGRLALFNGATEAPLAGLDEALEAAQADGTPLSYARQSGYQRIERGRTVVLMDTGPAPAGPLSVNAHAGCLSFEMSVGRNRLIVNCGATELKGPEWRLAFRATAAHSTLTLGERSSAVFLDDDRAARLLGWRILTGPEKILSERSETDDGVWLETAHDGYVQRFGVEHRRRLFVAGDGEDIRGEDSLVQTKAARAQEAGGGRGGKGGKAKKRMVPYAARFHLHPDVRASLARDGKSVLLLLPSGDGWQFRAAGGQIGLEESAYLGAGDSVRRSEQIVVRGDLGPRPAVIKWALRRLARNADA